MRIYGYLSKRNQGWMKSVILAFAFVFLLTPSTNADPLFVIDKLDVLWQPAAGNKGCFERILDPKVKGRSTNVFVPCIWVKLRVREKISNSGLTAKIYLFDPAKKPIYTMYIPDSGKGGLLPILEGGKPYDFFLPIPESMRDKKWVPLAVFGDQNEATAKAVNAIVEDYQFSEHSLLNRQGNLLAKRVRVVDPVVLQEIQTRSRKQPKITLLMRPPRGIADYSEVRGVLCTCVLANSVDEIKRQLLSSDEGGDRNYFGFADQNKLAIVAWGSSRVWTKSYFDLDPDKVKSEDHEFDEIANGWERGMKELNQKYGIPMQDFLLSGYSAGSHWAERLVLRKPQYFLAVHLHIPTNVDKPTIDGNRPIWLITAGERDGGYQDTIRFVQEAKKLGYPIIHKGIIGMGHSSSPINVSLGLRFFEYALTLKAQRDEYDKSQRIGQSIMVKAQYVPWPKDFQSPPFYGDMVNQERFSADKAEMIPAAFRVALPNRAIADAWNQQPETEYSIH